MDPIDDNASENEKILLESINDIKNIRDETIPYKGVDFEFALDLQRIISEEEKKISPGDKKKINLKKNIYILIATDGLDLAQDIYGEKLIKLQNPIYSPSFSFITNKITNAQRQLDAFTSIYKIHEYADEWDNIIRQNDEIIRIEDDLKKEKKKRIGGKKRRYTSSRRKFSKHCRHKHRRR
jgi:hypothetical protein